MDKTMKRIKVWNDGSEEFLVDPPITERIVEEDGSITEIRSRRLIVLHSSWETFQALLEEREDLFGGEEPPAPNRLVKNADEQLSSGKSNL